MAKKGKKNLKNEQLDNETNLRNDERLDHFSEELTKFQLSMKEKETEMECFKKRVVRCLVAAIVIVIMIMSVLWIGLFKERSEDLVELKKANQKLSDRVKALENVSIEAKYKNYEEYVNAEFNSKEGTFYKVKVEDVNFFSDFNMDQKLEDPIFSSTESSYVGRNEIGSVYAYRLKDGRICYSLAELENYSWNNQFVEIE